MEQLPGTGGKNGRRAPERRIGNIELHLCDCMALMASMPDGSADIVLTDPPYMYLRHRTDAPFDIERAFREAARVLRKDRGAMVVFGRGPSFYRTGTVLERLGLRFLEEVVWHKPRRSSPATALGRVHETISIWGAGRARINRVRVPATEKHRHDPERITRALDAIAGYLKNPRDLAAIRAFAENGTVAKEGRYKTGGVTLSGGTRNNRAATVLRGLLEGNPEDSVMRVANMDDYYARRHPAQKPVALLKRLLALVAPPEAPPGDVTVLDPFGGSFSAMQAAMEMGMRGISCEILPDCFERGAARFDRRPPL